MAGSGSAELRCTACGYPLSGTEVAVCPSCLLSLALESGGDEPAAADETLLEGHDVLLAESQPALPEVDPLIGSTVGVYRVEELVGQGGMGQVYRALHTRLDRVIALKALPIGRFADPRRRRRFLLEAKSASSLAHPNIVTVHDLIAEGGRDFLVMEFVDGPTLHDAIPSGGLELARALRYAEQIADGLGAAHKAGIIHRDLKPGNVMIAEGDVAKLVDFGLAKLMDDDQATPPAGGGTLPTETRLTRAGARVGTAHYMSPEQALGGPIDPRSDIFSFGAVLYEMLSGRQPFSGPSQVAVMNNVVYKEPQPLAKHAPRVPARLRQVIAKALQKKPEDRYQTAEELKADLAPLAVRSQASAAGWPAGSGWSLLPRIRAVGIGLLLLLAVALAVPPSRHTLQRAGRALAELWVASADAPSLESMGARELYQRGLEDLARYDQEGRLDGAVDAFQRAIGKREGYAAAYSGLAAALRRKASATGDRVLLEQAESRARQALELEPELLEAEVHLALILIDLGRLGEARTRLERSLKLDPSSAPAYRGLGDLAVAEGELDLAIERYQKAIDLAPADRELHGLLGSAYYRAGQFQDAVDAFRRRVELAPDDVLGRKNVAAALHMLGDYSGAIRELQEAIKIRPEWSVYNNLGTLYFFQGLYEEAVRAFESAVDHGAQNYLVWANLGDAYRWTPGQQEKAGDAYLIAVQLVRKELEERPEDVTRRSRLALFLAKRGDLEEALVEAGGLADEVGDNSSVLYRLATVRELTGDREGAIELLGRAFGTGYSMIEFERDPEFAKLRASAAGQTMLARVEAALALDR